MASALAGPGEPTGYDSSSAAPGRSLALTSLAGVKGSSETQWLVFRENVRRFVAGEPLLGVVQR